MGTTDEQLPLFPNSPDARHTAPTVCLSLGMGADSTAILLRWLHELASRDFDLDELAALQHGRRRMDPNRARHARGDPAVAAAAFRALHPGRPLPVQRHPIR